LMSSALARPVPSRVDGRVALAGLALCLLLARHAAPLLRRLRRALVTVA
jgi:hypothetical protein